MATENNLPAAVPELGKRGVTIRNVDELIKIAEIAVQGGWKRCAVPQAAAIIGYGAEVGFGPFTALRCIDFIQGTPQLNQFGILALITPQLSEMPKEWIEGTGDQRVAWCSLKRRGVAGEVTKSFAFETAKKAGYLKPGSYWLTDTDLMMAKNALARAARRGFGDLLQGMYLDGEIDDGKPPDQWVKAEPAPAVGPVRETRALPEPPAAEPAAAEVAAEVEAIDEDSRKKRIGERLLEITHGDTAAAKRLLMTYSSMNGILGVNTLRSPLCTGEYLVRLDHRVRDEYHKWKKGGPK